MLVTDDGLYGRDATELLDRWDAGCGVFTIEMGGLGPGYEQCIQITMFEILRDLLVCNPIAPVPVIWEAYFRRKRFEVWKPERDRIDASVSPRIDFLGLTGAQWGAAVSLATALYMRGPRQCFKEVPKDRLIQTEKEFPAAEVA